jgi:hypothetical protein
MSSTTSDWVWVLVVLVVLALCGGLWYYKVARLGSSHSEASSDISYNEAYAGSEVPLPGGAEDAFYMGGGCGCDGNDYDAGAEYVDQQAFKLSDHMVETKSKTD